MFKDESVTHLRSWNLAYFPRPEESYYRFKVVARPMLERKKTAESFFIPVGRGPPDLSAHSVARRTTILENPGETPCTVTALIVPVRTVRTTRPGIRTRE